MANRSSILHATPFAPNLQRSKLDFKTSSCIFLGYSPSHKGYKCLAPASGNIFIRWYVTFDEGCFPLLSSSKESTSPFGPQTATIPPFPKQLFDSIHGSPIGTSSSSLSATPPLETDQVEGSPSPSPPCAPLPSNAESIAPQQAPTHTHPMVTQLKDGKRRPNVFISTCHPIPSCFLANSMDNVELTSYTQALKIPNGGLLWWKNSMPS